MSIPPFAGSGDLPEGVHEASLEEVVSHFGQLPAGRKLLAVRLERIYGLVAGTGHLKRFVVFGSFMTNAAEPNDVDLFLVMDNAFDVTTVLGEARFVFDHDAAQTRFGASVFWLRSLVALPDEDRAVRSWQAKRDGTRRGIVEIRGATA